MRTNIVIDEELIKKGLKYTDSAVKGESQSAKPLTVSLPVRPLKMTSFCSIKTATLIALLQFSR